MEVPRPYVHGEITVEHGNFLWWLGQLNLEYRSLNARAKDDLAPVLLKQFAQEPFEMTGGQGNIRILGGTAIEVLDNLRKVHIAASYSGPISLADCDRGGNDVS